MLRTLLTAGAALSVITLGAQAQDFSLNPTYGSTSLSAGFTPDPRTVTLQAGGSISASNLGCAGYIANAPDYRINYTSGSLPLIISVNASSDTTLVINTPDGRWSCDDDGGNGVNPSVRFNSPMSGQYDIWVGTYSDTGLQSATLHISELYSQ